MGLRLQRQSSLHRFLLSSGIKHEENSRPRACFCWRAVRFGLLHAATADRYARRLIGSALTHGSPGGAIAGGLIGAGTGALIGNAATAPPPGYGGPPPRQCAQWGYDYNGNRVCTAFY
jgi:hypothetical protein